MKILVCDDIEAKAKRTRNDISAAETGHDIELLSGGRLKEEIEKLFVRAGAVLNFESPAAESQTAKFCCNFDVAILDNNLSDLKVAGARHTAESIAGYVRAFGAIPYVVSLNKNPHVDFDLRYLVGDYQTHADLALNNRHLSNRALWTGDPRDAKDVGFLPWYWPVLNAAPNRRRRQIRFVEERLDEPILKSLGISASASHYLSRHARGALSPRVTHVTTVTFMKFFVTAGRSLPIPVDRTDLAKAAIGGDMTARHVVARIVAGEVDRWVRRDLLGPQDLLVDVPHLLMRLPFVLGQNASKLECWNEAVMETERHCGLSDDIYGTHLKDARYPHDDIWTKSPCFWWRTLKSDVKLNQMFFAKKAHWPSAVFCEDLSRFRLSDNMADRAPMEFSAEFEGAWNRRHVAHLKGMHYTPKSRLAK